MHGMSVERGARIVDAHRVGQPLPVVLHQPGVRFIHRGRPIFHVVAVARNEMDQSPVEVNAIAEFLGLDIVQLHGSEKPGFPSDHIVMKALKVRDGVVPDADGWPDPVLLDSWSLDSKGGTGHAWNWESAEALSVTRQVFVAGGLNPLNVGSVIRRLRPYGVDVSSGVESEPRVKSPALIGAFIDAVRRQQ